MLRAIVCEAHSGRKKWNYWVRICETGRF